MGRWVLSALLMLSAPIVATMLIRAYNVDRTVLLAVQYAIWAVCAYVVATSGGKSGRRMAPPGSMMARFLLLFILGFIFATVMVASARLRSDIGAVGWQVTALIYMTLPFFVLKRAARLRPVDRLVLGLCHLIMAFGLYSVGSDFVGLTHYEVGVGRYFGALGDAIAWALTLPLIVYFAARRFVLAAIAAMILALTASRGPFLLTATSILLLIAFARGRRAEYVGSIALLLLLGVYQAGMFSSLLARLSRTEFLQNDRTTTAALGFKIFQKSPIFGSGYNSLTHFYPATAQRGALGILPAQTSTFVQMLSDGGMITFFPYACFVLASTIAGISLMRRSNELPERGLVNGLVAWLIGMLWVNQSALWFVVGSYFGPLVFAVAGLVAGCSVRLREQSLIKVRSEQAALGRTRATFDLGLQR